MHCSTTATRSLRFTRRASSTTVRWPDAAAQGLRLAVKARAATLPNRRTARQHGAPAPPQGVATARRSIDIESDRHEAGRGMSAVVLALRRVQSFDTGGLHMRSVAQRASA
ncbi:MAG: hypothetical protein ACT4P7_10660 [Gemmatimonadaceae bacterium]